MATLDLGTLGFEISVDTGSFDAELDGVKSRVEQVDKQLNKASKTTLKPLSLIHISEPTRPAA